MRVQRVVLDQNSVNQSVRAERIAVTVGRKRKYTTKAAAWGADGVALIDDVLVLRCTLYAERSDMSTFLPKPLKVKVHGDEIVAARADGGRKRADKFDSRTST